MKYPFKKSVWPSLLVDGPVSNGDALICWQTSWLANLDWYIFKGSWISPKTGVRAKFLKILDCLWHFFKKTLERKMGESIYCKRRVYFHSWATSVIVRLALSRGGRHMIAPHWDCFWWIASRNTLLIVEAVSPRQRCPLEFTCERVNPHHRPGDLWVLTKTCWWGAGYDSHLCHYLWGCWC